MRWSAIASSLDRAHLANKEPCKTRLTFQNVLLLVVHIDQIQLLRSLGERFAPGRQQPPHHHCAKGIEEESQARPRRKRKLDRVAVDHTHRRFARPEARQMVRFFLAIRTRVGLSSTPTTRRKGNSAAISMARPIPAPTSMKLTSSIAHPGRLFSQRLPAQERPTAQPHSRP